MYSTMKTECLLSSSLLHLLFLGHLESYITTYIGLNEKKQLSLSSSVVSSVAVVPQSHTVLSTVKSCVSVAPPNFVMITGTIPLNEVFK